LLIWQLDHLTKIDLLEELIQQLQIKPKFWDFGDGENAQPGPVKLGRKQAYISEQEEGVPVGLWPGWKSLWGKKRP
jgi:hypothetical protein